MLRVRENSIGSLPKNKDRFDPKYFLKRVFKKKGEDIVVLDANKLPENLRDIWGKETLTWITTGREKQIHKKHKVDENVQEDIQLSGGSVSVEDIGPNEVESVSVEDIGHDGKESTRPKVAEKEVLIEGLVQEPEY